MAERNDAGLTDFDKRTISRSPLDRSRDSLWKQEPPRNDVPVPRIHDDIDFLI